MSDASVRGWRSGRERRDLARWLAWCACLLGIGCGGPRVIWSGRSPDRTVEVRVLESEGDQRIAIAGAPERRYDAVAIDRLRWSEHGVLVPAQRGDAWWLLDGTRELGPFLAIGRALTAGAHVAFVAQRADGWHVVSDDREGEAFDAIDEGILLDGDSGAIAYVARRRGAEHAVWGDRVGPPCESVALMRLGAKGRMLAYVDRGARDRLMIDHQPAGPWSEVLEIAVARDEPRWAAIVGTSGCALVQDGTVLAEAPLLTHLRVSDDGAHVACLSPAEDGSSVEVIRDGTAIARHRRVEGDALAFVPGTATLVFVAEDSQGLRVVLGDRTSERYEELEGPIHGTGHAGWIGRRGDRSELVLDGETIATEEWAGSLRLAREGDGYAYVARRGSERFVVTRRGSWPVGRLFVDTLVVDRTASHWAALVPDPSARRLDVWIDGTPRAVIEEEELGGAAIAGGAPPLQIIRAILAGELARATARASER